MKSATKLILWVSRIKPPFIVGASFEAVTSGKEAIERCLKTSYAVILLDSDPTPDGFNGVDLVKKFKSLNVRAPLYLMGSALNANNTIRANAVKAHGFIRHSAHDVTLALRTHNALDWSKKLGRRDSVPTELPTELPAMELIFTDIPDIEIAFDLDMALQLSVEPTVKLEHKTTFKITPSSIEHMEGDFSNTEQSDHEIDVDSATAAYAPVSQTISSSDDHAEETEHGIYRVIHDLKQSILEHYCPPDPEHDELDPKYLDDSVYLNNIKSAE